MGYFAPGKIFEKMLQLKRFGLYYERILKSQWLSIIYRNSDISNRDARGFGGMLPEKLFIIKSNDYSYTPGCTLLL